jgi:putative DNA methylase
VTYKKKLIEVALPLAAISAESAKQKTMGGASHPQNLHRWWARRPLAATRAVLWASLVDDPSALVDEFPTEEDQRAERKRLHDLFERLIQWEASNDQPLLAEARAEIAKSAGGKLPQIVDPFGGGGAIPLEATRLGLPTFTGDLNPVAVLLQRAMLEIPHGFAGLEPVSPVARSTQTIWGGARGLAADVDAYGNWMLEQAQARIGHQYPNVVLPDGSKAEPLAWIWARTVASPDPSWPGHTPLVRNWVLAKKPGKPTVWVEPVVDSKSKTIRYEIRTGGTPLGPNVDRGSGRCVATGAPFDRDYVVGEAKAGRMGEVCLAVVAESHGRRVYVEAADLTPIAIEAPMPFHEPVPIAHHPRNVAPGLYGFDSWTDLFTSRQLLALTTFSDLLHEVHALAERDAADAGLDVGGSRLRDGGQGATAYADAVVTYLAFVVDKCADFWSSACSWNAPNSQIRFTFSRQAIAMTWDFAEANPFSGKMASWESMHTGVVRALADLPTRTRASVAQRDARARIREAGISVLSTDPPYYDNISYADLSDFFYIWLRRGLREIWPDECATLLTPKADELIANQYRAGSKKAAQAHFEIGMQEVFAEAAKQAHPDFPSTIFYAFKATETTEDGITSTGWETFLAGVLDAGFTVTATWPIRTEFKTRMVASGTNALASSIVLACRQRLLAAPLATRGEFISALRAEMEPAVRLLQTENIAPVDLAQSAIGPGIAIFSRYAKVIEADGSPMTVRTALGLINETLGEVLSGEESEFDADTRFALTWFDQFGHNPGPFGDADLLARAKDTTVAGVALAGVVASREGKVRLVERSELPSAWDPATDTRLTVWETTQQLIRALDSSESEAAALLTRIGGGLGDRARQLAYLLYGVCDRKKWAEEAGAYNMLVTAWPEITKLAASEPRPQGPESLF